MQSAWAIWLSVLLNYPLLTLGIASIEPGEGPDDEIMTGRGRLSNLGSYVHLTHTAQ